MGVEKRRPRSQNALRVAHTHLRIHHQPLSDVLQSAEDDVSCEEGLGQ